MSLKQTADSLLKKATDSGDVPGVVAMATNGTNTLYEGAFGKRILGHLQARSPILHLPGFIQTHQFPVPVGANIVEPCSGFALCGVHGPDNIFPAHVPQSDSLPIELTEFVLR